MELDKTILEKICYDRHNSGSEKHVPIKLNNYQVIIDLNCKDNWTVECSYSYPFNKSGWSYNDIEYISKLEYQTMKTKFDREDKLNDLGL